MNKGTLNHHVTAHVTAHVTYDVLCLSYTDGEWVKCDKVWISKEHTRDKYDWIESTNNFRLDLAPHPGSWYDASYDPASTATLAARLAISFTGQ